MADVPEPLPQTTEIKKISSPSSFFTGNKRIPSLSFWGYFFSAVVVDVTLSDWLPVSGTVFVAFCWGMYKLNGYKTDKLGAKAIGSAIAGIIPIIADFSNIYFVVSTYMTNVAETKPIADNRGGTGESRTAQAASLGMTRLHTSEVIPGETRYGPGAAHSASADNRSAGYEQKNTGAPLGKEPPNARPRDTGYQTSENGGGKSVDGIAPPAQARRDNVGYQPTQPVFKQGPPREEPAPRSTVYENTGPADGFRPPGDASDLSREYANDNSGEAPEESSNPEDRNVGYREAA